MDGLRTCVWSVFIRGYMIVRYDINLEKVLDACHTRKLASLVVCEREEREGNIVVDGEGK